MDKHICHPLIFSVRLSPFISPSHPPFSSHMTHTLPLNKQFLAQEAGQA